eukprot:CFRG4861T1
MRCAHTPRLWLAWLLAIVFVTLLSSLLFRKQEDVPYYGLCLPTVVWSRGIARACCDVHPNHFLGETAADVDYNNLHLVDGQSVYVDQLNMLNFVKNSFLKLPKDVSIVLVSGQEDAGQPLEMFGRSQRNLFHEVSDWPISLDEFLSDTRLKHWFVQNYDLSDCHKAVYGKPDCKDMDGISEVLAKKVSPIPIGLDLHTFSEREMLTSACTQQTELESLFYDLPAWTDRPQTMLAVFNIPSRGDRAKLLKIIKELKQEHEDCVFQGSGISRNEVWTRHGSVPVVVSSPMDSLYREFPIVILNSWDDIKNYKSWKKVIVEKFGPNPFNFKMRHRFTTGYWAGRISMAK